MRKVKDLNSEFKELIIKLYKNISLNDIVKARMEYGNKKYDIIISINGVEKIISIKSGISNTIYTEKISDFIIFLLEVGVDNNVIKEYLNYHYGDGTLNGTGKTRLSVFEYQKLNQDKIDYINTKINDENIINKVIDKYILQSSNLKTEVDAIVYGTEFDFFFITKEEIRKTIINKKDTTSTSIHFGKLHCKPAVRCLNFDKKYERRRHYVVINWYSIFDDVIECMEKS